MTNIKLFREASDWGSGGRPETGKLTAEKLSDALHWALAELSNYAHLSASIEGQLPIAEEVLKEYAEQQAALSSSDGQIQHSPHTFDGKFIDRNGIEYNVSVWSDKTVFENLEVPAASYFVYHEKASAGQEAEKKSDQEIVAVFHNAGWIMAIEYRGEASGGDADGWCHCLANNFTKNVFPGRYNEKKDGWESVKRKTLWRLQSQQAAEFEDFTYDEDIMHDFYGLSKIKFLEHYKDITDAEYEATRKAVTVTRKTKAPEAGVSKEQVAKQLFTYLSWLTKDTAFYGETHYQIKAFLDSLPSSPEQPKQ